MQPMASLREFGSKAKTASAFACSLEAVSRFRMQRRKSGFILLAYVP
jgi:hypothetical protein